MMNKEQFFNFMKYSVQDMLNDRGMRCKLELEKVIKKNDQALTGLVIRGKGENISPCIYLDDMYQRYAKGQSLAYLSSEIADLLENTRNPEFDFNKIAEYESAKEYLSIRLVGIDENEKWLADKIWEPMGDFAKVCYLDFGVENDSTMSAVVTMRNMALMGVTKEQMMADAQKNLDNKTHIFKSLSSLMAEMMSEMNPEDLGYNPLYVLTNEERLQGAAMLAKSDVMKEIGEKFGCDYYVLPSSTHEVLLVPVSAGMDAKELNTMVREINAAEVSIQDKLSDNVQYYDREREQLRNALDPVPKEVDEVKKSKEKKQER